MPDTVLERLEKQLARLRREVAERNDRIQVVQQQITERKYILSSVRQDVRVTIKNSNRVRICSDIGRLIEEQRDTGLSTARINYLINRPKPVLNYSTLRTYIKWMADQRIIFKRPKSQSWITFRTWVDALARATSGGRGKSKKKKEQSQQIFES